MSLKVGPESNGGPLQRYGRANPSLDHFPSLKAAIERDARLARSDEQKLAAFRAYRLNQGTGEAEVRNVVISANQYASLEDEFVDIGPEYVLGLDLSGGHAQTGVSAVNLYPDADGKHHVDSFRLLAAIGRRERAWQA